MAACLVCVSFIVLKPVCTSIDFFWGLSWFVPSLGTLLCRCDNGRRCEFAHGASGEEGGLLESTWRSSIQDPSLLEREGILRRSACCIVL